VTIKKSFEAQLKGIQGNVKLYVVVGLQDKA
jgi:hypothetical protein